MAPVPAPTPEEVRSYILAHWTDFSGSNAGVRSAELVSIERLTCSPDRLHPEVQTCVVTVQVRNQQGQARQTDVASDFTFDENKGAGYAQDQYARVSPKRPECFLEHQAREVPLIAGHFDYQVAAASIAVELQQA